MMAFCVSVETIIMGLLSTSIRTVASVPPVLQIRVGEKGRDARFTVKMAITIAIITITPLRFQLWNAQYGQAQGIRTRGLTP